MKRMFFFSSYFFSFSRCDVDFFWNRFINIDRTGTVRIVLYFFLRHIYKVVHHIFGWMHSSGWLKSSHGNNYIHIVDCSTVRLFDGSFWCFYMHTLCTRYFVFVEKSWILVVENENERNEIRMEIYK